MTSLSFLATTGESFRVWGVVASLPPDTPTTHQLVCPDAKNPKTFVAARSKTQTFSLSTCRILTASPSCPIPAPSPPQLLPPSTHINIIQKRLLPSRCLNSRPLEPPRVNVNLPCKPLRNDIHHDYSAHNPYNNAERSFVAVRKARGEEMGTDRITDLAVAAGESDCEGGVCGAGDGLHAPEPHRGGPFRGSTGLRV